MALPIVAIVAGALLLLLAVYKFVVYPTFVSSLARIPSAHWSSSISPAWILYHRQQQNDTFVVHDAHTHLGPVVRIAPNEISINTLDGGIRTIYSGGFEKGTWYSNIFSNYGVEPMFAMENHGPHSKRRRMLSNIYAKSILQASPALTKQTDMILKDWLQQRFDHEDWEDVEMYDIFSAATMDFVTGYIFGLKNGSAFLTNKDDGIKLFHDFKARQKYSFWPQEMAGLTRFVKRLGLRTVLVPSWVDTANEELEAWVMGMCEAAEKTLREIEDGQQADVEDYPTVYAQLRNTLVKDLSKGKTGSDKSVEDLVQELRLEIASELLDHTLAGFDTSGITLTWLAWQLSRPQNAEWQHKLRKELATLNGTLDAKRLDALPILHAVLMETLRMHAAIPGNQPRVTPRDTPTVLGDYSIPVNTRVQSQAYSLHRNPAVFPSPDTWDPSRWLSPSASTERELTRWFWAFSSGGRMCIGSNLAMLDMKAIIGGIWSRYATEIVHDKGMIANGGYMAEPLGVGPGGVKGIGKGRKFCRCRIRKLERGQEG